MDLVVDLNFRMDTSALYSDLVLPAATWYEKSDLNTTDMHSFIHPLSKAVPPCWEAKSDWQIFRTISKKFCEPAGKEVPEPVGDLVATPLATDIPSWVALGGGGPGGDASGPRPGRRDRPTRHPRLDEGRGGSHFRQVDAPVARGAERL